MWWLPGHCCLGCIPVSGEGHLLFKVPHLPLEPASPPLPTPVSLSSPWVPGGSFVKLEASCSWFLGFFLKEREP